MKKLAVFLALVLFISVPLNVQAVEPRLIWEGPTLTFSGTTAECELTIDADRVSDYMVVTLKLFQGNNLVKQWSKAGSISVTVSGTCTVTKGVTYTLTGEVMINGTSRPTLSVTKTC